MEEVTSLNRAEPHDITICTDSKVQVNGVIIALVPFFFNHVFYSMAFCKNVSMDTQTMPIICFGIGIP